MLSQIKVREIATTLRGAHHIVSHWDRVIYRRRFTVVRAAT
jgi:hypothetical protein